MAGQTRGAVAAGLAWLALTACDPAPSADAGAPRDGGAAADAGSTLDAAGTDAGPERDAGNAPIGIQHTYVEMDGAVGGPERGFYRFVSLTTDTDLSFVTTGGHRLVFSYVRLDDFRSGPIDAALLSDLEAGLGRARDAGLSVLLRFAYNEGPYPNSEPDTSRATIEGHIAQLEPLLRSNADVIALVQAGFIGAWGEWHTSTNDLLDDPADRRAILEALLDALPADRATQIRYPLYKQEMYGAPAVAANAFDGSYASRVGHHNDCFLSSETDVGTYPEGEVETWTSYVADDTRFVPMGGETCAPFPSRSDCAPALAEMERLHFSYVNEDYHPSIVSAWRDQGCYGEIAEHLGYRLVAREATFAVMAPPGATIPLSVRIANVGWAAPMNPRPLRVILRAGGVEHVVDVQVDIRRWHGGETTALALELGLPASIDEGTWALSLSLPPARASSRVDASLPFANAEFDASTGELTLGAIEVDDGAGGPVDPTRAAFEAELTP